VTSWSCHIQADRAQNPTATPKVSRAGNQAQGVLETVHQGEKKKIPDPGASLSGAPPTCQGGKVACLAGAGVGKTVRIQELEINNIAKAGTAASRCSVVWAMLQTPRRATTSIRRKFQGIRSDQLRGSEPMSKVALCFDQMNEPPGARYARWAFRRSRMASTFPRCDKPGCPCCFNRNTSRVRSGRNRSAPPCWVACRPPWVISPLLGTRSSASSKSASISLHPCRLHHIRFRLCNVLPTDLDRSSSATTLPPRMPTTGSEAVVLGLQGIYRCWGSLVHQHGCFSRPFVRR